MKPPLHQRRHGDKGINRESLELGANEVIPDEFETSIGIFSRALARCLIARDEIIRLVSEVRSDGYQVFRTLSEAKTTVSDLTVKFLEFNFHTVRVAASSAAAGRTLSGLDLRRKHGAMVLAVMRGGTCCPTPAGRP